MIEPNRKASPGQRPEITVAAAAAHPTLTGHGFLPAHCVTVRILGPDDIISYIVYSTDAHGTLEAPLPPTLPRGTLTISATDERPDAADETGRLWTHPVTIHW